MHIQKIMLDINLHVHRERRLTMTIMITEDDEALAAEILSFLKKWNYDAFAVQNFENITQDFTENRPQLILMDINLPYYDGFYWCSQIRRLSDVPILYISSRNDEKDKIAAVAQGGDDYIEKPFSPDLLRAKIEALLRRTYQYKVCDRVYLSDTLCYDLCSQSLYSGGREIDLTKSERRILKILIENKPDTVLRNELMLGLWDTDEYISDGALTTMICRLKSKLKSKCGDALICTQKGQGYRLKN